MPDPEPEPEPESVVDRLRRLKQETLAWEEQRSRRRASLKEMHFETYLTWRIKQGYQGDEGPTWEQICDLLMEMDSGPNP